MTFPFLDDNPFFVLGLAPEAKPMEIERAGQKLLALLAIGAQAATTYTSPGGARSRSEQQVREAVAALRDPERRAAFAFWAAPGETCAHEEDLPVWKDGLRSLGWKGP